jgi:hypothetical protein
MCRCRSRAASAAGFEEFLRALFRVVRGDGCGILAEGFDVAAGPGKGAAVDAGDWPAVSPWGLLATAAERDGERKPRLLACAWCRHVLDRLPPGRPTPGVGTDWLRGVIAAAERVAEGPAVPPDVPVQPPVAETATIPATPAAQMVAWLTFAPGTFEPALFEEMPALAARLLGPDADWYAEFERRQSELNALILEIFGPHPALPRVDPEWRAWNNGDVLNLAKTIYDDRRFDLLPILADALEEAGCDDARILAHCRGPGPHARGCWVVDLILGKM